MLTHYGCTTICSPIGGHLGGFQFGAITDKIAVSIMFKTLHGHVLSFPLSTSLDWNAWSVCERTFELCCCSVAPLSLTLCSPWTAARQAFLSFTNSWSQLLFVCLFFLKKLQNTFQVFMPFYIPTSNVKEFQAVLFLVYFLYNLQRYVVHVIYGLFLNSLSFFFFLLIYLAFLIPVPHCHDYWGL